MLLTDVAGPLNIRYGRRNTNPGTWDPMFNKLFVYELAQAIAPKLSQDRDVVASIRTDLDALHDLAAEMDAIEMVGDDPDDDTVSYDWMAGYEQ